MKFTQSIEGKIRRTLYNIEYNYTRNVLLYL